MNRRLPSQHFAARFAAKEAFLKALGAGMGAGIPWKDIEIITNPVGSPSLELHGKARESSCNKGVKKILVSLSHDDEHGVAEVVLEG